MQRPVDAPAPPRRARRAIALGVAIAAAGFLGATSSDPEAFDRLRSLPLRQRRALDANLGRFDRLDAAERAAIREVDRRVAGLAPEERDRAFDRLRRYHLWVESLPESRRDDLLRASPAGRAEAVNSFLQEERRQRPVLVGSLALRSKALNPGTLTETAFQIRCWRAIDPRERNTIVEMAEPAPTLANRRRQELVNRGHALGLIQEPAFFLPTIDLVRGRLIDPARRKAFFEEFRDQISVNAPSNLKPELQRNFLVEHRRKVFEEILARIEDERFRQAVLNPKANLDGIAKLSPEARQALKAVRPMVQQKLVREAEAEYLATNALEPVEPAQLKDFLELIPPWIEQALEVLPADEARLKLTALYRLVEAADGEPPRPFRAPRRAARLRSLTPPAPTPAPSAGKKPPAEPKPS
ncbi:MAG TPA: hypothetical protein VG406_14930 [Isosphaeraceae bacterium]|jgi:hypothetical protein|nr:hypothetical protein [Isosphaeraceae bacterium]